MQVFYDKRTNKKVFIYGVEKNKEGHADFLIRRNGQWAWESAKNYLPVSEWVELQDK